MGVFKSINKSWILLILGLIAICTLIIADFLEKGFSLEMFALPILILGSIVIPTVIDIKKTK